mgnify:CR=1 FL=1
MCTIEQAKKLIKERKIQERNMFIDMKREMEEHKTYYKEYSRLIGEKYETNNRFEHI